MPATAKGIFHNLRESKYAISNSEIAFYFSSEFYLIKFLNEYQENRLKDQKRMKNLLMNSPYNMNLISDICLYQQIEKRGFYARFKRLKISKDELYKYALRKIIEDTTLEWVRTDAKNPNK